MFYVKVICVLLISTTSSIAQHSHGNHDDVGVRETGQAQFAAIAEIVEILRNDASTDWGKVNIQALRDHLVDMHNVTTGSTVAVNETDKSVTFTITGTEDVTRSIQEMVPAHSPMLAAATNWVVKSDLIENGATMTIYGSNNSTRNQILGLGFFGLMTIGAHHQEHHLMIAMGRSPH